MKDLGGSDRPSHADFSASKMQAEYIIDVVNSGHQCALGKTGNGEYIPCSHQLWGRTHAAS
eukprot:5986856-Pleurochrysis_carterae.AAC.1